MRDSIVLMENFLGWRCVSCGEILDEVILENRQAGTESQSGDKENIL